MTIQLNDKRVHVPTESYMRQLRTELEDRFTGIKYSIIAMGLVPRTAPIEITLSGADLDLVMETAEHLHGVLGNIPGTDNILLSVEEGSPEYRVIPDKNLMQRFGLTTAYVGMSLRTSFNGNDDASITDDGNEYPVRVQLASFNRENPKDLAELPIINPNGMALEVKQ